jgi:hypothetical protein
VLGEGELGLNVRQQILDNIVFISVRGRFYCVDVIRVVALRHDETQVGFGEALGFRVIRPLAKATTTAVKQIHNRELLLRRGGSGKQHAILHFTAKAAL